MKKFFTLIAFAMMAVAANADVTAADTIKFTTSASAGALDGQTFTVGDLSMTVTDTGSKISVDENTAYFGTSSDDKVSFGMRMKSGGKSSTKNMLTFTAAKAGKFVVFARTGSNSATDRNVVISQSGSDLVDHVMLESEAAKETYTTEAGESATRNIYPVLSADVAAGEVTVTYPVGSINFYGFALVQESSSTEPSTDPSTDPSTEPSGTVAGSDTIMFAAASTGSLDSQTFTAGSLSMTITDTAGKVAIDANNAYFGTSADDKVAFAYRMKSGGKSSSKNMLTFTAEKAGTFVIFARTGSNSATDRDVVVSQDGSDLVDQVMLESNSISEEYTDAEGATATRKIYAPLSVEVKAGEFTVTYPVGSINFYGFALVPSTTTAISDVAAAQTVAAKVKKVVKNGRLVIETANGSFTVSGARIK